MNPTLIRTLDKQRTLDFFSPRAGETKLGQSIHLAEQYQDWQAVSDGGCRYVLLGVPEQIGPRANCGKGGAHQGWQAFLSAFLNLQDNQQMSGGQILLLGELICDDLPDSDDLDTLREQCEELDHRLLQVLGPVFAAGLIPIVIGGGHNNAYAIIRACSEVTGTPLAVTNLDPHADFRQQEGRHSGNAFRYAHAQGYLSHYSIVGLHEQKNSQEALQALEENGFPWFSIQQIQWRREFTFTQALEQVLDYLNRADRPVGVELDLDAISDMPTSAITRAGVALDDAIYYLHRMAKQSNVHYLHLAEAAPERHPAGQEAGRRVTGQALAEMVSVFIKAVE
ncbi:formimidoylglutamase [Lacimicrobium alkaliphilum]|uniref:Formimidoylglutamase HutG n=1 Tax=Lacimicrobium alkaliphilum TaxID=1526571 RepID=A0ABQ1RB57_9ALTE|nr:formimidoylglutamase [Lacimicrobium alkaliphilum]GGD62602.1 formimidoylglutamase HutG [Lacimicrobium alkaliphilum]